jgi:hypothetical protein
MLTIRRLLSVVVSLSLLAALSVFGQSAPLKSVNFVEHLEKGVPVSGSLLVGVQYETADRIIQKSLTAWIPSSHPSKLCLSVISDDGRYVASAEFSVSSAQSESVTLDFPTEQFGTLQHYGPSGLAILGILQEVCNGGAIYKDGSLTPISWLATTPGSPLALKVNSGGTDVKLFSQTGGQPVNCKKARISDARIAFDTLCAFSPTTRNTLWVGYVFQSRFGETPTKTAFNIWIPK